MGSEILVDCDGNAFAIMGTTRRALRRHGIDQAICDEYEKKAMASDYDHLMQMSIEYLDKYTPEDHSDEDYDEDDD